MSSEEVRSGDAVYVNFAGWSPPEARFLALFPERSSVPGRVIARSATRGVQVRFVEGADQQTDLWIPVDRVIRVQ